MEKLDEQTILFQCIRLAFGLQKLKQSKAFLQQLLNHFSLLTPEIAEQSGQLLPSISSFDAYIAFNLCF